MKPLLFFIGVLFLANTMNSELSRETRCYLGLASLGLLAWTLW
jgi:hypothetical protein